MLHISITIDIGFNCVNDTIICHTTLNDVITHPRLFSLPAVNNEVKPFLIVSIKPFYLAVLRLCELESVHYSLFCSSDCLDTSSPFGRLFKQWREIETWTEIQVVSANAHQRMLNNDI